MPWDSKNYPNAFKLWTKEARGKAIKQAESINLQAIEDGATVEEAARIAIAVALKT